MAKAKKTTSNSKKNPSSSTRTGRAAGERRWIETRDKRFPDDFMFQLTTEELVALTSQIAMSNTGRGGPASFKKAHDPALPCLTLRYGLWQTDAR